MSNEAQQHLTSTIKKPKDLEKTLNNKNQETHPKIQRETSTNPVVAT